MVNVRLTPVLSPFSVDDFHVIEYKPVISCVSLIVIDEIVDDIFAGGFAFPGTK